MKIDGIKGLVKQKSTGKNRENAGKKAGNHAAKSGKIE